MTKQKDIVIVKRGRFAGKEFVLEDDIDNMRAPDGILGGGLAYLACTGNWAARNALEIDKYTISNAPFYYGKIGNLGYIISHEHLFGNKKNV